MPHFIEVIARNEGHDGAFRAGRKFPNGQTVRLEVLDQAGDPPEVKDAAGRMVPNPGTIGTASEAAILKDPRLSTRTTVFKDGGMVSAALKEASAHAGRVAAELAEAQIEIVALKSRIAELEAELEAAKVGKGKSEEKDPAAKVAEADTKVDPKDDPKAKGGKGK